MDFKSLQYFQVVAQELNITRAAERLHMSQPPLSTQIHNLEEDLGVTLFVRGKRHLQLTEAGHLLLQRSEQMLTLADKTRSDLTTLENALSGVIHIGIVEGLAPFLAAKYIAGFQEEFPLVRYQLWNGNSDAVLDDLSRGLADVAVIARPYDREHLDGITLGVEPWVAILSEKHPLAAEPGTTVPLTKLSGEPLIVPSRKSRVESIRRWFSGIGTEANIRVETANYLDAIALAEQNVGISIFPRTVRGNHMGTVSKIITDPVRTAEYVLVVEKEQRLTPLVEEFINYVRDSVEEAALSGDKPESSGDFVIPPDTDIL